MYKSGGREGQSYINAVEGRQETGRVLENALKRFSKQEVCSAVDEGK